MRNTDNVISSFHFIDPFRTVVHGRGHHRRRRENQTRTIWKNIAVLISSSRRTYSDKILLPRVSLRSRKQ